MKFIEVTDTQDKINEIKKDIEKIKKDLLKVFDSIDRLNLAMKVLSKTRKGVK